MTARTRAMHIQMIGRAGPLASGTPRQAVWVLRMVLRIRVEDLLHLRSPTNPKAHLGLSTPLETEEDAAVVVKPPNLSRLSIQQVQYELSSVHSVLKPSKRSMIGKGMRNLYICHLNGGFVAQMDRFNGVASLRFINVYSVFFQTRHLVTQNHTITPVVRIVP